LSVSFEYPQISIGANTGQGGVEN